MSVGEVAGRARTDPRGELDGGFAEVRAPADVAKLTCGAQPDRPVGCLRPDKGVCHLVQQGLVHVVVFESGGEVARDRDAFAREVALAGSAFRVIECEGPRIVEVERDEGVRPVADSVEV